MIIKTTKFTDDDYNPYILHRSPYKVEGVITETHEYIIIEDEELGVKIRLDANPIVKFFRDEHEVEFDQTEEGEYICPCCGQYYDEHELSDYSYCKNCGVAIC